MIVFVIVMSISMMVGPAHDRVIQAVQGPPGIMVTVSVITLVTTVRSLSV